MQSPSEVFPGIARIVLPLPFELEAINVYLLRLRAGGYLLIDCGMATDNSFAALEGGLRDLGIAWSDIRQVLLTHMHPDHIGLAARVRDLSGATLFLHDIESLHLQSVVDAGRRLPWLTDGFDRAGVPRELRERIDRHFQFIRDNLQPLAPDVLLRGGEVFETSAGDLEVLWTPGHSPGHVCLYGPAARLLLSGDQILDGITPNISWRPENDTLGQYLESLQALAGLPVETVLPAHGHRVADHRAWVADTAGHHAERCDDIVNAVAGQPRTAFELVGVLWPRTLSPINYHFAVFEVLAHLEYLQRRGRIGSVPSDGPLEWRVS